MILLVLSLLFAPSDIVVGGKVVAPAGSTIGWDDSLMAITMAFNPGAGSGGPGLAEFPAGSIAKAYLFDDASDECVYGSLQLTHSYATGTAIKCHMHWAPLTNSTNSVNWQMYYNITEIGGTFAAATMLDVSDPGDGVPHKHQIADFPDIACASCGISSILIVELCRDANGTNGTDDMVGDVAGLYFDCHYRINSLGSSDHNAK